MLDWIRFIGEFFLNSIMMIPKLISMFSDALGIFQVSFFYAPNFLQPILFLTLAVVIIMWIVNIL